MANNGKIRVSSEFEELINYIRAKCMLMGDKCPSIPKITKIIAERTNKEKLWQDEFNKQ